MSVETSTFYSCQPRLWTGRYARVSGKATVFHLTNDAGRLRPAVFWETEYGRGTCFARRSDAAESLAVAVERGKRHAGGSGSGSFVINEFGQVLVPASSGGGTRFLVGQLEGSLLFDNPFDEYDRIDLADASCLQPGDPWKLPYVGTPYSLSRNRRIYFLQTFLDYRHTVYPRQQDEQLVRRLTKIRGESGCRFIVNYAGIVLTRWEIAGSWIAVYVGTINKNKWFEREEGNA